MRLAAFVHVLIYISIHKKELSLIFCLEPEAVIPKVELI